MIEDDLRVMFRERVEKSDPPAPQRLTDIRNVVSAQRRRVARIVVASVTLVVAVTVTAVPLLVNVGADVDPARESSISDRFPEFVNGDTRVATMVGKEGDRSVTLEFIPERRDFLIDFECASQSASGAWRSARVNGHKVDPGCGQRRFLASTSVTRPFQVGGVGTENSVTNFWLTRGVEANEPVTVTLHVGQSRRSPREFNGRLGIGVYEMTGERMESKGVALPQEWTVEGKVYQLADSGYDVAAPGDVEAAISIPRLAAATLVVYGVNDFVVGGIRAIAVDGNRRLLPITSSVRTGILPAATSHRVEVERGVSSSRSIFVAYYTRSEGG